MARVGGRNAAFAWVVGVGCLAILGVLALATVLILGDSEQVQQDGDITLNADTPVNIQHWEKQDGGSIIPFFTSLEALQKAVEDEQPFIAMPARVLFEITQGADLFLNPKAEYGKEFYPEEVAMLLAICEGAPCGAMLEPAGPARLVSHR